KASCAPRPRASAARSRSGRLLLRWWSLHRPWGSLHRPWWPLHRSRCCSLHRVARAALLSRTNVPIIELIGEGAPPSTGAFSRIVASAAPPPCPSVKRVADTQLSERPDTGPGPRPQRLSPTAPQQLSPATGEARGGRGRMLR